MTDRHLLQATGQAGGRDTMARPLGAVEALQRTAYAVAAGQWCPAAPVLLPGSLSLQEAQGVHLHWLWNQAGAKYMQLGTVSK